MLLADCSQDLSAVGVLFDEGAERISIILDVNEVTEARDRCLAGSMGIVRLKAELEPVQARCAMPSCSTAAMAEVMSGSMCLSKVLVAWKFTGLLRLVDDRVILVFSTRDVHQSSVTGTRTLQKGCLLDLPIPVNHTWTSLLRCGIVFSSNLMVKPSTSLTLASSSAFWICVCVKKPS